MAEASAIVAHALGRRFGDFTAVRGLELEVQRGEVFGLLGANGAGKTTAIRMLCGTLAPSEGSVTVAGVDMLRHARRARSRIGYVTQRFTLYADLTALENLRLQAGLYDVRGTRLAERLDWALERLELRAAAGERAGRLPLGFQRRLAVAAALLHQPDVLFLDEPTSGIDPLARQRLWELVYELSAQGVGVLVTTHYMDEALFCDRLALMDRGAVVAGGTPQALLARPLATPLVELQGPDVALLAALAGGPQVHERLPRAGRLRVRLQPGTDVAAWSAAVQAEAARRGAPLQVLAAPALELEDVFVDIIERRGVPA
ncbi:ABC transporter ATP-binding protein [Aquabacterium sp.]|uniref:ABC transporter ATP-binding protein n=1 Tax=Aquabacterium sp. TaxID=1872578 RepID=UPI003783DA0A